MKTIYLIDGYAQFFRAYHAIRSPMTSPVTGEPTNMMFGFIGMLLKLLRGEGKIGGRPDYLAVAIDVSGDRETFRSELYPAYKANRPPPPDDLRPQVERALAVLELLGVPVLGVAGVEADDVIASLARRLHAGGEPVRVRIVSKDKDLKQLLADDARPTELYDVHTDELITVGTLREETGLEPGQVVDMLALAGDTVDNVPGVPGIGVKTAAKLIAEHGSLDALLARAAEIKGKRGENIRATAELLPLSKQLVTLRDDVGVELDLDAAAVARLRLERLGPVLKELGFNRYQDELRALIDGPEGAVAKVAARDADGFADSLFAPAAAEHRAAAGLATVCIRTREELEGLVRRVREAGRVAVDTETTGLRPMRAALCGVSLALEAGEGYYVPVRSPEADGHLGAQDVVELLGPVLEDASVAKIGHNLKFDILVLRRAGVRLRGIGAGGDSMVASYLLDASRSSHGLDALAMAMLGHENISITELIGRGRSQKRFDEVPLELATPYAAEDAEVTLRLMDRLGPALAAEGLDGLFRDVEMPLVEVLAELEWNGIRVDAEELERQRARLQARIDELNEEMRREAEEAIGRGFDPDSPRQLSAVLFNKPDAAEPGLGIRPQRKTKTGYSTDAEVLEKLATDPLVTSPIPHLVLEYRQLTKLVSTYLVSLREEINPETGRIHASFNQTVAATGRLSSSDPNLQNIPIRTDLGREIRRAFVAEPGHVLITADYSQIELRLLAHLSKDPALTAAFHAGEDIHAAVAAQIHGVAQEDVTKAQRAGAKMVNFGIVYGITPFGLARRLGVSNDEASGIIDGYKRRFAGITTFLEECVSQARERGYVETMLGRRRPITDIESNQPQRRALAERMAINSVVQGSAADLIKLAMIDLHRRIVGGAGGEGALAGVRMLLQIHDELVFEAPEGSAEAARGVIVERMERAMELDVPLRVDSWAGRDWYSDK